MSSGVVTNSLPSRVDSIPIELGSESTSLIPRWSRNASASAFADSWIIRRIASLMERSNAVVTRSSLGSSMECRGSIVKKSLSDNSVSSAWRSASAITISLYSDADRKLSLARILQRLLSLRSYTTMPSLISSRPSKARISSHILEKSLFVWA